MYTPEINDLKNHLESLKSRNLLKDWNLPNESKAERCRTVTFFVTPINEKTLLEIIQEFDKYENLRCIINTMEKSTESAYKISFLRNIFV